MILAILLLIFAAFSVLGTLIVVANKKGGVVAWIVAFNTCEIVIMTISALALMQCS
jgi:hypothetical protein